MRKAASEQARAFDESAFRKRIIGPVEKLE